MTAGVNETLSARRFRPFASKTPELSGLATLRLEPTKGIPCQASMGCNRRFFENWNPVRIQSQRDSVLQPRFAPTLGQHSTHWAQTLNGFRLFCSWVGETQPRLGLGILPSSQPRVADNPGLEAAIPLGLK